MTTTASGPSSSAADRETLDVRLVRRVARTLDRDPTDLPPLGREMDLDALASLAATDSVTVSFEYGGCDVRVGRDGGVTVTLGDGSAAA